MSLQDNSCSRLKVNTKLQCGRGGCKPHADLGLACHLNDVPAMTAAGQLVLALEPTFLGHFCMYASLQ